MQKRKSVLVHSLFEAGLRYRERARIAKCSHGSVSASRQKLKKIKELAEKKKIGQLTCEITENSIDQTVDQMKAMKLPDEMVSKVQQKLESDARESVRQIPGDVVYETIV